MSKALFDGPMVSLEELLSAKEYRAELQKKLLDLAPDHVLLSATMNIPGPIKTSKELTDIFNEVMNFVEKELFVSMPHVKWYRHEKTGDECYFLLPLSKEIVKKQMIEIEENYQYGRLVDLDVLFLADEKICTLNRTSLGYMKRTCLVCHEDAKICGRSGVHTLQELRDQIQQLVKKGRK